MTRQFIAALCGCLLLSGCAMSEINEVTIFEYDRSDNTGQLALKTAGNVAAAAVALPAFAVYFFIATAGNSGVSGGATSRRVTLHQ